MKPDEIKKEILILGGVISAVSLLFNHPLRIEKPTFIYIDRDDTADSVYVKLQRDLNATHLTGFKMLARLKKYDQQIHSGSYRFDASINTLTLFRRLSSGHHGAYRFDASINTLTLFRRLSSGHQTPVKVVIPSVRTLSRLARSLDRQLSKWLYPVCGLCPVWHARWTVNSCPILRNLPDLSVTVPSALHWVSVLKRCLRYSSRIRMKPIGIRTPKPLSNE